MALALLVALLFGAIVIGGGVFLFRRYVRAVELRSSSQIELANLREQVSRLEEALDSTRTDIERLQAAQDFTQRLLSNRSSADSSTT